MNPHSFIPATTLTCLACRSKFEAPAAYCPACELPLVDWGACNVIRRDQIARASLVLQRRAQSLLNATYPERILRPERVQFGLLSEVFTELASLIAALVSNIRQWGNAARERVAMVAPVRGEE